MRRTCITCDRPTVVAREIDGAIKIVDPEPVPNGGLVLIGELADEPTAMWGIDPAGETMPWGTVVEAGAPRYRLHECAAEPAGVTA